MGETIIGTLQIKHAFQIGSQLQVTWFDNHVSRYDIKWLLERSFSRENRENYLENHYRPKPKLWSKNQFEMKVFEANDVFTNDEGTSLHFSLIEEDFKDSLSKYLNSSV